MKWTSIIAFFVTFQVVSAQDLKGPDLVSLVKAEESFSRMAKEKSTRDAFLSFLRDDAITFVPGDGPRIGKDYLENQKADSSWLHWWPVFTDVAASGDFGYNTGPWEFRLNRTDSEPVAFGQFISLWKKNEKGEWQVALDVGIRHKKPLTARSQKTASVRSQNSAGVARQEPELFDIEKSFSETLAQKGCDAYRPLLSEEGKLFRPGYEPFYEKEAVQQYLSESTERITCTYISGEISASLDLACVYGTALRESMQQGVRKTTRHGYVRFWKKENGRWKIVMDILSD